MNFLIAFTAAIVALIIGAIVWHKLFSENSKGIDSVSLFFLMAVFVVDMIFAALFLGLHLASF